MAKICFESEWLELTPEQTVLEALEKAGHQIPNSCRSGLCHSCLLRADQGTPPLLAQQGLSGAQQTQQYLLACRCCPDSDLELSRPAEIRRVAARLLEKTMLSHNVLRARLTSDIDWQPGQYITVWRDEMLGRSFSIASLRQQEGFIELHIRLREDGVISEWLHQEVAVGNELFISLPLGNSFYTSEAVGHPLLLAGTGTGLAPLYGVLKQALAQKHDQDIFLYAAAGEPKDLYLVDELRQLAESVPQLHYHPVVRRNPCTDMLQGDLIEIVGRRHPSFKEWFIYSCGAPGVVKSLQKKCFLQGASMKRIYADRFETPVKAVA